MKRYPIVTDDNITHLDTYGGEQILVKCVNYFYHGRLAEVNEESIKLENAYIIYLTGSMDSSDYEEKEKLPDGWCIMKNAIESFGVLKVIENV